MAQLIAGVDCVLSHSGTGGAVCPGERPAVQRVSKVSISRNGLSYEDANFVFGWIDAGSDGEPGSGGFCNLKNQFG